MKYYIGYYQDSWREQKVQKFIVKSIASSKEQALQINKQLSKRLNMFEWNQDKKYSSAQKYSELRYKILTEQEYLKHQESRKQASIEKRKYTISKKTPEQKKRTFILCPHCRATSKLLYSEMGGLQTRVCKNGHRFEYDKWIGDRLGSIMLFSSPVKAAEFISKNPIKVV
jgi:hypothetical protein